MKKGFTLLELMVVIGIIGILSAILLKASSGSSDSARAAQCLSNMHDLANACHAVAMETGRYPSAGSIILEKISIRKSKSGARTEQAGWVSWASMRSTSPSSGFFISTYEQDEKKRLFSLTNGAIWKAISGNASSYRCPIHKRCAGIKPIWSYVMNSDFGWDTTMGAKPSYADQIGKYFKTLTRLDRRLLFAELPFNSDNGDQSKECKYTTTAGSIDLDPTLQYEKDEVIGFNHKNGRKWYAHVCFTDGHVEKLELPGLSTKQHRKELTTWLCGAKDITYNGAKYEELKQ